MTHWRILPLILTLAFLSSHASAHHAFAAEFSANSPVALTGTVTRMAWLNPHARVYMEVRGRQGLEQWEVVLASPNVLIRQGLEKSFVKSGEVVTVTGFRARDGSHLAAARIISWPDGRVANLGSAGDGGPAR